MAENMLEDRSFYKVSCERKKSKLIWVLVILHVEQPQFSFPFTENVYFSSVTLVLVAACIINL